MSRKGSQKSQRTIAVNEQQDQQEHDLVSLYLGVMKRSLVNWYYREQVTHELAPWSWRRRLFRAVLSHYGLRAVRPAPIPSEMLTDGRGMADGAYTLVGLTRLDNVEYCVRKVLEQDIPGDLLEAGVWKGGTCIFMRSILKAYGILDRKVWVADSFKGLPAPDPEKYPADARETLHEADILAVSADQVRGNFRRYDLLDDQVQFLEGYFRDTLRKAPIERLAVLRLDGDMYESTMDTLVPLYPKLSVGGYVIIDDYARENCRRAVVDYREQNGINDEIQSIDWTGVFWRKSG